MSSNGNGKRSDFYRKRAIEIADFFTATKTIKDNPYVQRTIKDVHQIVDEILEKLEVSRMFTDIKGIDKKYLKSDFVSKSAATAICNRKPGTHIDLVYEHLVPKKTVLFKKLEEIVNKMPANLEDQIFDLLMKYYFVATITKQEDINCLGKNLKTKMPDDWNGEDVFARYKKANLFDELIETELFEDKILEDK